MVYWTCFFFFSIRSSWKLKKKVQKWYKLLLLLSNQTNPSICTHLKCGQQVALFFCFNFQSNTTMKEVMRVLFQSAVVKKESSHKEKLWIYWSGHVLTRVDHDWKNKIQETSGQWAFFMGWTPQVCSHVDSLNATFWKQWCHRLPCCNEQKSLMNNNIT